MSGGVLGNSGEIWKELSKDVLNSVSYDILRAFLRFGSGFDIEPGCVRNNGNDFVQNFTRSGFNFSIEVMTMFFDNKTGKSVVVNISFVSGYNKWGEKLWMERMFIKNSCLLYTSDAADE